MGKRDIFDMVKTSMFDRDMIPSGILVLVKWVASVWFIFSIFTTPGRGYSQKRHGPAFVAFLRALAGGLQIGVRTCGEPLKGAKLYNSW